MFNGKQKNYVLVTENKQIPPLDVMTVDVLVTVTFVNDQFGLGISLLAAKALDPLDHVLALLVS